MSVLRETIYCTRCGNALIERHKYMVDNFVGDTFVGYEDHVCPSPLEAFKNVHPDPVAAFKSELIKTLEEELGTVNDYIEDAERADPIGEFPFHYGRKETLEWVLELLDE